MLQLRNYFNHVETALCLRLFTLLNIVIILLELLIFNLQPNL